MSYQRAKTRHPFKCITRHAKRERNRFHKIGAIIIRAHPVLSQSACIALAGVFLCCRNNADVRRWRSRIGLLAQI